MNKQSHIGTVHSPQVPIAPASGYSPVTEVGAFPSKMKCLSCDGEGKAEYMGLCEDRYHWRGCHVCDGTGVVAPYCETCEQKLTVAGFCVSCDDFGSLIFVERISPSRIAL